MSSFYQWETVDLELVIEDDDGTPKTGVLDGVRDVAVSLAQGCTRLDVHIDDLHIDAEASTIDLHLSQEEAGRFSAKEEVVVQVNILYENGERDVTEKGFVHVYDNLYRRVME